MIRSIYYLFLVCAITPLVYGIPPPVCEAGTGLIDPSQSAYGTPNPKLCKKCEVPGCQYCLDNYKKCETCAAGTGLNSGKTKCVTCAKSNCGVCNDNYKVCDAKIPKCGNTVKTAASAAKKGAYAPDQESGFDYCQKAPGFTGNGYSSMFTGAVVNGVCIDCNGDDFRPYSEGGVSFCVFDKRGREVTAMAFPKKSGCAYPSSIKYELMRTCVSQSKHFPFLINLVYSATYCGETKTIIAAGGGSYKSKSDGNYQAIVDPASKWEYIIQA